MQSSRYGGGTKPALVAAMRLRLGSSILFAVILAGAGIALFQQRTSLARPAPVTAGKIDPPAQTASPPATEAFEGPLPPNHPQIPGASSRPLSPDDSPAALAWTAPPGWDVVPNRSPLRLATYRAPARTGGPANERAELTVTRAGGSTADNLERWVGQFDGAGPDKRATRVVGGLTVSTVEVNGTYEGDMTRAGNEPAHPGWGLAGAVVETTGPFYFFKMVGPAEAVRAARPAFDALLLTVRPPR